MKIKRKIILKPLSANFIKEKKAAAKKAAAEKAAAAAAEKAAGPLVPPVPAAGPLVPPVPAAAEKAAAAAAEKAVTAAEKAAAAAAEKAAAAAAKKAAAEKAVTAAAAAKKAAAKKAAAKKAAAEKAAAAAVTAAKKAAKKAEKQLFITICDTYDINGYISIHYLTKMCQENKNDLMIILPERKGIVDKPGNDMFTDEDFKENNIDYTYETNIQKSTRVMKQSALLFNKVFQEALDQKTKENPTLYIIRGTVNKLNTYNINNVIDEEEIYKDLIKEDSKTQIYTYYTVEKEEDLLNMLSPDGKNFKNIINRYEKIIINLTGSSGFYDILEPETKKQLIIKIKASIMPIYIYNDNSDKLEISFNFLKYCSESSINIIRVSNNNTITTDNLFKDISTNMKKNTTIKKMVDNFKDYKDYKINKLYISSIIKNKQYIAQSVNATTQNTIYINEQYNYITDIETRFKINITDEVNSLVINDITKL